MRGKNTRISEIRVYARPTANMKLKKDSLPYEQMIEPEIRTHKELDALVKYFSKGKTSHQMPKSNAEIKAQQKRNAMKRRLECQAQRQHIESITKKLKTPY